MIGEAGREEGQPAAFLSVDVGGGCTKRVEGDGKVSLPMYFVPLPLHGIAYFMQW